MLLALPGALIADVLVLLLLRRGLSAGRSISIVIAFIVTVAVWAALGRAAETWLHRRRDAEP
jgi:hypothetical protein